MNIASNEPNKYYTFTMTDTNGKKVELSLSDEGNMTLNELLEQLRGFLGMCDYHFDVNDRITVVNEKEEWYSDLNINFDTPTPTEWQADVQKQSNSWVEYGEDGTERHYTSTYKPKEY